MSTVFSSSATPYWIAVLDQTNDPRGMINSFMNSLEYRQRFGP